VWLSSWGGAGPAAIDFAVTSGLRADRLSDSAGQPAEVWNRYEEFKRSHLDTEAVCRQVGLSFVPFVVEAHGGGLGRGARQVCAHIAKAAAGRKGDEVEVKAASLMRSISVSVHRENARAILRRLPASPLPSSPEIPPEAWADEPPWQ